MWSQVSAREHRVRYRPVIAVAAALLGLVLAAESPAQEAHACELLSAPDAVAIADSLYAQRDYQAAAECYDLAGDTARAHRAFAKAIPGQGERATRSLKAQGQTAQALFSQVGRAFHSSH